MVPAPAIHTLETVGFLLAMPTMEAQFALQMTETVGVQAMHDSASRSEKPTVKKKYLTVDQAHRIIDVAGKMGRQGERTRLMVSDDDVSPWATGSELIDLKLAGLDLDAPCQRTLSVRRLKGSKDCVHTLEPDEVRLLKRLKAGATSSP